MTVGSLLNRLIGRHLSAYRSFRLVLLLLLAGLSTSAERISAQIALPAPGIIGTIAGTGQQGYTGDGGLATSETIYQPTQIAIGSASSVYISEMNNNRIRKLTASTGVISTTAGNGTAGYNDDGRAATIA
jgi:hypothetical protein